MKTKFSWLAVALLPLSALALAGDMPWTFNGTRAEGYAIDLVSAVPAPGTPLVRGERVEIKITASREVRIFVPLTPKGLEETYGEIVIRYPVVKKR